MLRNVAPIDTSSLALINGSTYNYNLSFFIDERCTAYGDELASKLHTILRKFST